jgi:hypothetical protein
MEAAMFPVGTLALSSTLVPLAEAGLLNPVEYLSRHASGDWGDQGADGWTLNDSAIGSGYRILSMYDCPAIGEKLYVETDGACEATVLYRASEY